MRVVEQPAVICKHGWPKNVGLFSNTQKKGCDPPPVCQTLYDVQE